MLTIFVVLVFSAHGADATTGDLPHCADLSSPVAPAAQENHFRTSTVQNTAWLWLRTYQLVISRANGSTCAMFPSCSRYAMQAFRKEGPLLGYWLTAARLMSPHKDRSYRRCVVDGAVFLFDPPEEDIWWH
jgi:putative component of membrane protein insertase Oxa1/YidC/SpoIIIJ protein YidD